MTSEAAADEALATFIAPVQVGSCILGNQVVGTAARARDYIVFVCTADNSRQLLFAESVCILFALKLVKVNLLAEIQPVRLFFSQNFVTQTCLPFCLIVLRVYAGAV